MEKRNYFKLVQEHEEETKRKWHDSLEIVEREGAAKKVRVTEDELIVELVDGRTVSVPIAWYPRLLYSSEKRKKHL